MRTKLLSITTALAMATGLWAGGAHTPAASATSATSATTTGSAVSAASDVVGPLARAARLLETQRLRRVPWARSPKASQTVRPSIVGGSPGSVSKWPWIVSLQDTDGFFSAPGTPAHVCGGSLVAPQWVLSARHCFRLEAGNPDRVVLGQTRLSGAAGQVVEIDGVVMHPFGNPSLLARDFALVHLAEPADVARADIEPIALLADDEADWAAPGASARVAGWGTTDTFEGDAPDDLQTARVRIADDAVCQSRWDQVTGDMGDAPPSEASIIEPDVMVCTDSGPGVPGWRGQNVCNGDSGGPLVVFDPSDKSPAGARLVGVTSFGYECGSTTVPSVFAEPAGARAAIEAIIDGTTPLSTFTVSQTGSAVTIDGTDRTDRIVLYCDGGTLRADLVPIGSPPARCGTDDVTSITANLGSGNDLIVFDLSPEHQAPITAVEFNGGGQRSSAPVCESFNPFTDDYLTAIIDSVRCALPVGDGLGIIAASDTPTSIEATSATTIDGDGALPSLEITGLEGVFLVGTPNDDTIDVAQLAVPMALVTRGGRDQIAGSSAADYIEAGTRDDVVNAGPGDDLVVGGSGDDVINGGDGNDSVLSGEGVDVIDGGEGDDGLSWTPGDGPDRFSGGAGTDTLEAVTESFFGGGEVVTDRTPRLRARALAGAVLAERRRRAVDEPTPPPPTEPEMFDTRADLTRSAGEARLRITLNWYVTPAGVPQSDRIDTGQFDTVSLLGSYGSDQVVVDPQFGGPSRLNIVLLEGTDHVYTAPLVGTEQQIAAEGKRDNPPDVLVVNALGQPVTSAVPPPVLRTPGRGRIVSSGFERRIWTNAG